MTRDLVRPSRDGDQFHYHWAARQCLSLLPGAGDLAAVTIEGSSATDSVFAGEELIDVGLYYGSEALQRARQVRYIQLKHSTHNEFTPWTLSGLSKTIRGFAKRYSNLRGLLSNDEIKRKVRFGFTTNRPVEEKLLEAIADLRIAADARHPELQQGLIRHTGLSATEAAAFFQLFYVEGGEPRLWAQRNLLYHDVSTYLAEADYDSPIQLKELVTRKATTEFESNPSIRRHDVLRALKVTESDLLPSPCEITALKEVLPREQQGEALAALLKAKHPLIVHAEGGVGKSMLALQLSTSMPNGSEAVLYDCFGDGLYRNALHFRHRHRDALVQISNELAARGLCHPLIPSSHADAKQYMRAFIGRLSQATTLLRARDASSSLCLLIDAADNADMAAEEQGEASFVRDLIRTPLPDGVRLAFTCRTHRRDRLGAPPEVHEIELRPFSEAETALHLRGTYPDADNAEVAEFAFLTSSNPRVQALALERELPIQEMLKELGPAPSTVERAIAELLQRAVDRLKDRTVGAEASQIDLICQALAVLRPLVPISIISQISGTSESAVRSFALDLGRPLHVKGSSLHFLDEPAETWFREKFKPDSNGLKRFLDRLRPLATGSAYVASTLPQLLLAAGQIDELVAMALIGEGLPTTNALERRDVELQRLIFALKACLHRRRDLPAAKLALKAGGETAGESRQTKLIQENTDIAAVLLSPDRIDELVSRRTFKSSWMGSHHAYDAGLLSGHHEFAAEAASRLRMAIDWLYAWARRPSEEHVHENVDDADRVELAMAILRLRGPGEAARFLRGWTPRRIAFSGGRRLARRLVDLGQYQQIESLASAAGNDIWLLLGLAIEVAAVGRSLPTRALSRLMRLLGDRRVKLTESTEWNSDWDVLYAVSAAVTLAVRSFPGRAKDWCSVLQKYLPDEPPACMAERYGFDVGPMLRAYALEAALRGAELTLIHVAPSNVRKELEAGRRYGRSQDTERFENDIGGLLAWFIISAEVAAGRRPANLCDRIAAAAKATLNAESRDYQRRNHLRQTAAPEWLQILAASGANEGHLDPLRSWITNKDKPLWTGTLMSMCRAAARFDGLTGLSLELAAFAFERLEEDREDAESRADSYQMLARAILPVSPAEAAAYFDRAVEISSRIGDENTARWTAFLDLSNAASQPEAPRARSAYRLSRAAELTYEYVARDKYFDWDGTVRALSALCGASSIAILSRWRDRGFGREGRLLPVAVYRLMERALLPAWAPIALSGLNFDWNRLGDLKRSLSAVGLPPRQRLFAQIAYRYMRLQSNDEKTWTDLLLIGKNLDVDLVDVTRLQVSSRALADVTEQKPPPAGTTHVPVERRDPNWDEFFFGIGFADAEALRKAYADLRTYDPPYQLEDFFKEGIRRAGLGKTAEFVHAISSWPDFGAIEFKYLLDALPAAAYKLLSLRKAIHNAAMTVCRREPERMRRRGWGCYLPFERLDGDGIVPDRDVVNATIEGYAAHVDTLDANALFQLVDPLASCLSPNEADEALHFGFDLLEEVLREDDSDGLWSDELKPPASCIDALAGYIWAGLGSPAAAARWEFAHVVRTAAELEWIELLGALEGLATNGGARPFVDHGLTFYEWHGRQWLLIGLARGAIEQPKALHKFAPFLQTCAAEEHVLIRAFATDALRTLHDSGLVSEQTTHREPGNQTTLPLEIYEGWRDPIPDEDSPGESELSDEDAYRFGIDIGPYWFAPLARAFGITEGSFERRARRVLRERLGVHIEPDDTRYKRRIYDWEQTRHSHGSMPLTDDLRAYHSYHAMMIVAARLLSTLAVRKRAEEQNDKFQDWIAGQLLTRADGRWLADRRDPRIIAAPPRKESYSDTTWYWRVTADYLDQLLWTDDGLQVFWGDWRAGQSDERETVSIRCALVSRDGARALLAALQTAPDTDGFLLPDANDARLEAGHLRLSGWVTSESEAAQLDEFDPWAAKISYPGPRPSSSIAERLGLVASPDRRRWTAATGNMLRSESWSNIEGYGREQEAVTGSRLSGNREFVKLLLETHPDDCLVLSASVRRVPPRDRSESTDSEPYPSPYVRYYLMDSDGIARPL